MVKNFVLSTALFIVLILLAVKLILASLAFSNNIGYIAGSTGLIYAFFGYKYLLKQFISYVKEDKERLKSIE